MTEDLGRGRRVTIVGAGIGGLTTAVALQQLGFAVDVYEAAETLTPAGAGILLAPNALQVLAKLGLVDEVVAAGHMLTHSMKVTDATLRPIQNLAAVDEVAMFGYHSTAIHRAALQEILLKAMGEVHVHTGKRCARVEQDAESATLHCEDGTLVNADFLLGADGIRSVVRRQLFPQSQLRYSGETCWRGIANLAAGAEWRGRGFEVWGQGVRFGVLPISEQQVYWFSTEKTAPGLKDGAPATVKAMLVERFKDFAEPVPSVMEATPPEQIMRHDLYDFVPIRAWVQGRVGLIGDAAHATTPNMGQGGCQAIEDAWGLQQAFRQHDTIEEALHAFQEARRPKAMMVVNNSYRFGKIAQLRNPLLCWLRNALLRLTPTSVILKQLKQLYRI